MDWRLPHRPVLVLVLVLLLLLFLLFSPGALSVARAEEPGAAATPATAKDRDASKTANARAKQLFSIGLFREAAAEYARAYRLRPHAAYLFNLAQCHKRLPGETDLRKAIFYFQSFLKNAPASPFAEGVQEEVAALERKLHRLGAASAPPVGPAPPRAAPQPFYKRWWFWTVVGAVVIGGAAASTAVAIRPGDESPVAGTHGIGTLK